MSSTEVTDGIIPNQLLAEIESDFEITNVNLGNRVYTLPNLHNKYLRKYFNIRSKLLLLENEYAALLKKKLHYYNFEFNFKLSEKQANAYVEGDDEVVAMRTRVARFKLLLDVVDRALRKASNVNFEVKNILEYMKMLNGG